MPNQIDESLPITQPTQPSHPPVRPPPPPTLLPPANEPPSNTSLTTRPLPIARLPYSIPLPDLLDTKLVILAYSSPHIPPFSLLPCFVDMLSTAFFASAESRSAHLPVTDGAYTCSMSGFWLQVKSSGGQGGRRLEWADLVALGKGLVAFQQEFTMPGLRFNLWVRGVLVGDGHAIMQVEGAEGAGVV